MLIRVLTLPRPLFNVLGDALQPSLNLLSDRTLKHAVTSHSDATVSRKH